MSPCYTLPLIHRPRLSQPSTPNEIQVRLPALAERLRTLPVRLAYLHDSFLRIDSLTPLSDLDLAFLMEPHPPGGLRDSLLRLHEVCGRLFPDDLADIAILNNAAPEFRFKVIEKGQLFGKLRDHANRLVKIRELSLTGDNEVLQEVEVGK